MRVTPEVGSLVFRSTSGRPEILLVQAREDPGQWVFPKGHPEPAEAPGSAVLRELREEAGVEGELVGPIDRPLEFTSRDELVRVQYYLVQATKDGASPEGRGKQWLSVDEGLERLTFEESRELLRTAWPEIERCVRATTPKRARHGEDHFEQLLLAEYAHMAESLLRNEEAGERRVTVFITLTTGVGAAVAFAAGQTRVLHPGQRDPLVILGLLALLALGYLTFVRIVSRNVASDRYKRRLGRVRRYFVMGPDDPRLRFLAFDPFQPDFRKPASWRVARGGWLETVAMIDALLLGALTAVVVATGSWMWNGVVGALVFCLVWPGLIAHGNTRHRRQTMEARDGLVLDRSVLGNVHDRGGTRAARRERKARRHIGDLGFIETPDAMTPAERRGPCSTPADEVLVVLDGNVSVVDVKHEEIVNARSGDALFIPAGLVHRVETEGTVRWVTGRRGPRS